MAQVEPQGFLARPPAGAGPGVLVLHAWWGLNETIKGVCERLAEEGFVAFAPDLYHGQVADTVEMAETLGSELDAGAEQAKAEVVEAARFLKEQTGQGEGALERGLAVVGFSLGAYYALELAAAEPELIHSVVLFYGSADGDYSRSKATYLGHFAENDAYEPPENVEGLEDALRNAGRLATFYRYAGVGHWFFEPDRVDAYDEAAAQLAWERTLGFLKDRSQGGLSADLGAD
jgi:carboxymethylenebutenolidase